jgi:hypothetical protein
MARRYATDSELVTRYPELETVSEPLRLAVLEESATMINLEVWGDKASFGHRDLTAHRIAMTPGVSLPGAVGIATSRRIGEISTSYSAPSGGADDAELQLTRYGKNYLQLRETVFVGAVVGGM